MNKITYKQFLAGALLHFNAIEPTDLRLMVDDFENIMNTKLNGLYTDLENLNKYIIIFNNGKISLRDALSTNSYINSEKKYLKDIFELETKSIVNFYFNNLNLDKFNEKKNKLFDKDFITNNAHILLIAKNKIVCEEMMKYGFNQINYFDSLINADSYFKIRSDDLKDFDIIITGSYNYEEESFYNSIRSKINSNVIRYPIYNYLNSDNLELTTFLIDRKLNRKWEIVKNSYSEIFDEIVKNAQLNNLLEENVKVNNKVKSITLKRNQ